MMQIRCPQCRRILEFHEESAGLIVRCGGCGQQMPGLVWLLMPRRKKEEDA